MPFPKRDAVLFRQQQYVTRFNYTLGALAVLAIAILAAVCRVQFQEQPRVWFLVAVAVASAGVGSLAGFLFATFGDETKTFAPTLTVLNGLVGGFAIADLSKDESIVRRFFISIAATASLPGGGGMVGLLAIGFGASGFLAMYVNKKMLQNPLASQSDALARSVSELGKTGISDTEPGQKPQPTDPATLAAAREVLANDSLLDRGSHCDQIALAKAQYLDGKLTDAEQTLRETLQVDPRDPDGLFYLSHVLLAADRPIIALPFLERLALQPKAPVLTWKLLGYAYLFDATQLEKSERATNSYLALRPDDWGAWLNLACVFGQRGPDQAVNVDRVVEILSRVFLNAPQWRQRVQELMAEGEDFSGWTETTPFLGLVNAK